VLIFGIIFVTSFCVYKKYNAPSLNIDSDELQYLKKSHPLCLPILLYGFEICPCNALDFIIARLFMKLFKTNNMDTVNRYVLLSKVIVFNFVT